MLVSWCFEPSQSQRITSGLKPPRIISGLNDIFIQRYIVERTNKAELDKKNRVRTRRLIGRIYGMKYSLKGH